MPPSRRAFLRASAASGLLPALARAATEAPAKVVVWDERQPAQKAAYPNFLGNAIADHLRTLPGLDVRSVALDDPGRGLDDATLDGCRVLLWWGHARQAEVAPEVGRSIVARIKAGTLGLIALHSAHWSTPFVEAMNERARLDLAASTGDATTVREVPPPTRYTLPKRGDRLTPYIDDRKYPDGRVERSLHLPDCCFPAYRGDGKPSTVKVLKPDHPIARGIPATFEIPQTEMYDEPFHVPEPDEVVFEERWPTGEWFRSGMTWRVGKGRVVYVRPGHETYPIYSQPIPLKLIGNAVAWLATGGA